MEVGTHKTVSPHANASPLGRRPGLALLLLVPAPTLGVLAAMFLFPATWYGGALYQLAKLWILVLPVVWLLRVERVKTRPPWPRWRGMPAGLITGVLTLVTIIGAWELIARRLVDIEHFREQMQAIGLSSPVRFLAFAAGVTLINALLEEYVWRWFVYGQWRALLEKLPFQTARAIAIPGAIVLAALCFTLHHSIAMSLYFDPLTNLLASTGVFLGGVTWSTLYVKTRNLYAGYLSHILADVALFYVGYRIAFG